MVSILQKPLRFEVTFRAHTDAILFHTTTIGHVFPWCNVMSIERRFGFNLMIFLVVVSTLPIDARSATTATAVFVSTEDCVSEIRSDRLLAHATRLKERFRLPL
jgi:hypothetical protein